MARRSVKWAQVAWDDLEQIADHIAKDSKTAFPAGSE
jgi:plasmid stabilization system protein ParE